MFVGEHSGKLGDQGRLKLPPEFVNLLRPDAVLAKGLDRCLDLMPARPWDGAAARVQELPRSDWRVRGFRRKFFGGACRLSVAEHGRLTLPESLKLYASILEQVVLVGVGDRIEIWAQEAWTGIGEAADKDFEAATKSLLEGRNGCDPTS